MHNPQELCIVCRIFDEGIGHCRPLERYSAKYPWSGYPRFLKPSGIHVCDVGERRFYKRLKFKYCSHGRNLYEASKSIF